MKTTDKVEAIVRAPIQAMGYELDEVEFVKEQGSWVLTIYIDSQNGVTIDDCEKVSRAVDPMLDEADPIEQPYYLSVSSIGIDRPLKKDKDFERNMGKKMTVKLYAPTDGKKELFGTLVSYAADAFEIEENGQRQSILRKDAASIKPYISFE
ncbi:MAG: ribosome maturation factor RimP [Clostridia bacterium]